MVGPEGALTLVDTAYSGGSGPPYCGGLTSGQVAVVNVRSSYFISTLMLTPWKTSTALELHV